LELLLETANSNIRMMDESDDVTSEEFNHEMNGTAEQPKEGENGEVVNVTNDQDDSAQKDDIAESTPEADTTETENGDHYSSSTKVNGEGEVPEISTISLNDTVDKNDNAEDGKSNEVIDDQEDGVEEPQPTRSSSPPNSPLRASSLSSTPERPSSLSSTPERASSLSSTPERISPNRPPNGSHLQPEMQLQDDDTWMQITKRDRQLSSANAIAVMDHAHTVLEKRICEASDQLNLQEGLHVFETTLGRLQNSEIKLGRRYDIQYGIVTQRQFSMRLSPYYLLLYSDLPAETLPISTKSFPLSQSNWRPKPVLSNKRTPLKPSN
jgi:hypothetical protein